VVEKPGQAKAFTRERWGAFSNSKVSLGLRTDVDVDEEIDAPL